MTAITSKTFEYAPSLSLPRGLRAAGEALKAGARLLAHAFTAPSAPTRRSRAQEAEAVRAMAYRYEKTEPGFAADLYAAAARHEGMDER